MKQRTRFKGSTHHGPGIDTPSGASGFGAPSRNRACVRLNNLSPVTTGTTTGRALVPRARVQEACVDPDP